MLTYEEFIVPDKYWDYCLEQHRIMFINEYFNINKKYPSEEEIGRFILSKENKERFKRMLYGKYLLSNNIINTPNNIIEIGVDFSIIDDNNEYILGVSNNDNDYKYEYWNIIYFGYKKESNYSEHYVDKVFIGSFDSLKNIKIRLNSLYKYNIYVYYRKSNFKYDYIVPGYNIDNNFHEIYNNLVEKTTGEIISFYEDTNLSLLDKEYIGAIMNYTPIKNDILKGQLYLYNPTIHLKISNVPNNIYCIIGNTNYNNTIINNDNNSFSSNQNCNLIKINDNTFSCDLNKSQISHAIYISSLYELINNGINIPTNKMSFNGYPFIQILTKNNNILYSYNKLEHTRNSKYNIEINIPYQGEDFNTDLDFDIIED